LTGTKWANCAPSPPRLADGSYLVPPLDKRNPDNQLYVFPNPSDGVFSIKSDLTTQKPVTLSISNTMGQVVWKEITDPANLYDRFTIDNSALAEGIYVVRIQNDDIDISTKLMVSH